MADHGRAPGQYTRLFDVAVNARTPSLRRSRPLTVTIQPQEAINSGAGWRLKEKAGTFAGSETGTDVLGGVNYVIEFNATACGTSVYWKLPMAICTKTTVW